jgi:hypothetical protein
MILTFCFTILLNFYLYMLTLHLTYILSTILDVSANLDGQFSSNVHLLK